jgi:hypothetical protein
MMSKEVFLKNHEGFGDVYMIKAKNTGDVDLDYLLENKAITKKKYKEMQGKDIYEIYYRYPDDDYGSAGSWWFDSKKERDKHWDLEINKAREVNNE